MVYANADITKAGQAKEIIAFADYWNAATGSDPGLLVFDSQLTTCKILDELTGRGINWLTGHLPHRRRDRCAGGGLRQGDLDRPPRSRPDRARRPGRAADLRAGRPHHQ